MNIISKQIFDFAKGDLLSRTDLLDKIKQYQKTTDLNFKDELRDEIVKTNMRLVINLSKHYVNQFNDINDIIQNGVIGLLVALDRFELNKKTAFSTYAVFWINHYIQQYVFGGKLINTHRYLNTGSGFAKIYFKCIADAKGDAFKFIQLLRKRGIDRKRQSSIENIICMDKHYINLYESDQDDTKVNYIDKIEDVKSNSPYEEVLDSMTIDKLSHFIKNNLSTEEQILIKMMYFEEGNNLKMISEKMDKCYETIGKIKESAINKLSDFIKTKPETEIPKVKLPPIKLKDIKVKDFINRFNLNNYSVDKLPLRVFSFCVKGVSDKIYRIEAPTLRGAINFLRDNTSHFLGIELKSIDGEEFLHETPIALKSDFKRAEIKRINEEISRSKWSEA